MRAAERGQHSDENQERLCRETNDMQIERERERQAWRSLSESRPRRLLSHSRPRPFTLAWHASSCGSPRACTKGAVRHVAREACEQANAGSSVSPHSPSGGRGCRSRESAKAPALSTTAPLTWANSFFWSSSGRTSARRADGGAVNQSMAAHASARRACHGAPLSYLVVRL